MTKTHESLIGIDLGTTNSVLAYIDPFGRPICLPNSEGDILTPSVVFFDEAGPPIVGKEAIKAGLISPENVADIVKRDMGKEVYRRPIRGKYMPPAAISGVILHRMVQDAADRTGPFQRAVVTVPAYFNEPRRRATIEAALMAGLKEVEIINEPTAAALAFGFEMGLFSEEGKLSRLPSKKDGVFTLLVYDLGGGTFDVTLMKIQDRNFRAIVCEGDVQLGGHDWDERIVDFVVKKLKKEQEVDLRKSPESMQLLWQAAEEAKKSLTQRTKTSIRVQHGSERYSVDFSRLDLMDLTEDLLGRTRMTCELAMQEAKLSWKHLDALLLVGGSTRMAMVQEMLREMTGMEPNRSVSPDEAVAQGAALYAQMLWGVAKGAEGKIEEKVRKVGSAARITNVNSHSLGIVGRDKKNGKRKVAVLIPKNTEIPHSNTRAFRTREKGQPQIYIPVVEGESPDPDDCALIGECHLVGLPKNLPPHWPVSVTFAYRRDGRIFVEAQVQDGEPFQVEIDRSKKVSETEAETWANELIGDWDEASAAAAPVSLPSLVKTGKFQPKKRKPKSDSADLDDEVVELEADDDDPFKPRTP